MDAELYKNLVDQVRNEIPESENANKEIAIGFALCIVVQLDNEAKDYESCLSEIYQIATTIANPQELLKELFDLSKPVSLLCADTDKVKSYVFGSAKLPEVRGASIILDELNKYGIEEIFSKDELNVCKECLIYYAGGSVMAIVPSCKAQEICKEIEKMYLGTTKVATITAISEPFHLYEYCFGLNAKNFSYEDFKEMWRKSDPKQKKIIRNYYDLKADEPSDKDLEDAFKKTKGFNELTRFMTNKLKVAKQNKESVPYFETGRFLRICDSCQSKTANTTDTIDEDENYLCDVCKAKREKGRQGKADIINKGLIEYLNVDRSNIEKYFGNKLGNVFAPPKDLNNIDDNSIGFIYADADNAGKALESLKTPSKYRQFSNSMSEITRNSIFRTITDGQINPQELEKDEEYINKWKLSVIYDNNGELNKHPYDKSSDKDLKLYVHPFEIISAGGDDLILIVPAKVALEYALNICKNFHEKMKEKYNDMPMSMSAGVVIASTHYPVYYLFDLASQLLKSAKKKSHDKNEGAIDFMIMTSQNTLSSNIEDYRKEFLEQTQKSTSSSTNEEKLYLTKRPYTLSEMCKLLESVRELKQKGKEYPISQLYGIVQALNQHSRQHSILRFLYQLQRHKDDDKKTLEKIMCLWDIDTCYVPWMRDDSGNLPFDKYSTVFLDILEIYNFVEKQESSNETS